jgi:hypothetical protein
MSLEHKQDIYDFFCEIYDDIIESEDTIQLMREPLIDFEHVAMDVVATGQYISDRWKNLNTCLGSITTKEIEVKNDPTVNTNVKPKRRRGATRFSQRKEKRRNKPTNVVVGNTVEFVDLTLGDV